MRPLKDRLLVRPIEQEKSAGGLTMIRGSADARDKHRAERCEVLAVGPGEKRVLKDGTVVHLTCAQIMGLPVNVGDFVYCERYLGIHRVTKADGTEDKLKLVHAADVLGVE